VYNIRPKETIQDLFHRVMQSKYVRLNQIFFQKLENSLPSREVSILNIIYNNITYKTWEISGCLKISIMKKHRYEHKHLRNCLLLQTM
jgi:hypothetical protein